MSLRVGSQFNKDCWIAAVMLALAISNSVRWRFGTKRVLRLGYSLMIRASLFVVLFVTMLRAGSALGMDARFPIKVSTTNPRLLAYQNNTPFLMVGDSPHSMIVNLSASDAAVYLADRAAHGFNSLWVELLCVKYTGGRTDGSLLDGTKPFTKTIPGTSSYDFTAPNEAYFAYVDRVMRMAATNGIVVMLDPIDPGGLLPMALDNGSARCRIYGQYLGNRYQDLPNLIWLNGNDFQGWSVATNDAVITSVAVGLKDKDPHHIQTVELNYQASSSLDDPNWASIVSLNLAYTYYATYAEVLHAYNQSTNVPVFMGEANYECETNNEEDGGSLHILRMQEYWTMLSGATGQLYGNRCTWTFTPGWQSHLDLPGVTELGYMKGLFSARKWYELVPDQGHTFVTAGFGTFISAGPPATRPGGRFASNDYVTAALTPDGSLGMAYLPQGGTLTLSMTRLQGRLIARWFDPTANTFKGIDGSPFANTGTQRFTTPGKNSAGDPDWVLVLERLP
jgi:Protein of unknown function (DUF4038)/Putative collagen-binding domain of a collagenase